MLQRLEKVLISGLLVCMVQATHATETLEREMDRSTFHKAGLHRLSEEELAYLNRYLGRADTPPEQRFGAEQLTSEPAVGSEGEVDRISSTIKGAFTGWEGSTVFRLANGQIWQQRVSGRYRYRADNAAVTIERGRFGYYLQVDETGRKVGVKRLK